MCPQNDFLSFSWTHFEYKKCLRKPKNYASWTHSCNYKQLLNFIGALTLFFRWVSALIKHRTTALTMFLDEFEPALRTKKLHFSLPFHTFFLFLPIPYKKAYRKARFIKSWKRFYVFYILLFLFIGFLLLVGFYDMMGW